MLFFCGVIFRCYAIAKTLILDVMLYSLLCHRYMLCDSNKKKKKNLMPCHKCYNIAKLVRQRYAFLPAMLFPPCYVFPHGYAILPPPPPTFFFPPSTSFSSF